MKITTEQLADRQAALTVQPDETQVQQAVSKAAAKISQRYVIPGYRKGKAPYAAIVRAVGKEAIYEQAADDMSNKVYGQALEESGLDPIAPGVLNNITFDPLTYHFVVPLAPTVDLGDYRSVRVERAAIEVNEEEVDAELTRLQQSHSEWQPLDDQGQADYGDLLVASLRGVAGEEEIINDEAFELILEQEQEDFPPGFETHFIGATAGSQLAFDITYPETWPSARAGSQAHFTAAVLDVKRQSMPDLNDDFAALVGEYTTLDELKAGLRAHQLEHLQEDADDEYLNQMVEALEQVVTIAYPPVLVDQGVERLYQSEAQRIRGFGIEMSDYLRVTKQTETTLRASMRESAEKRLRFDLLLAELIHAEQLQVSENELENYKARILATEREDNHTLEEFMQSPLGKEMIDQEILQRKALERLIAIGTGEAPDLPAAPSAEPAEVAPVEAEPAEA